MTKKLNIFISGAHLPPITGGIETHMWEIARHLVLKGHRVTLTGSLEKYEGQLLPESEVREGVRIIRIKGGRGVFKRPIRMLYFLFTLLREHRREPINILHCHYLYPVGVAGAVFSLISGVPLLVTEHGAIIEDRKSFFRRNIVKFAMRRMSLVIAASKDRRDICREVAGGRVEVVAIANGIDAERFNPEVLAEKQVAGDLSREGVTALFLGRLASVKGVHYFLEAVSLAAKEEKGIRALIVGGGSQKEFIDSLKERASKDDLKDIVKFVGEVPNDRIVEYIAQADFAVFPSLAEATSISALEVMACGVPIVASCVDGLREIVEDGYNGILVPFDTEKSSYIDYGLSAAALRRLADALIDMASDEKKRKNMGQKAADLVRENFTWKKNAESLEGHYFDIVGTKKDKGRAS